MNNNIILFCKRHNLDYTVQPLILGYTRIAVNCANYAEFDAIRRAAAKHYSTDSHIYTLTVYIYDRKERAEIDKFNVDRLTLTDIFFNALHEGKTPDEAKQAQFNYATEHGTIKAYNYIYA